MKIALQRKNVVGYLALLAVASLVPALIWWEAASRSTADDLDDQFSAGYVVSGDWGQQYLRVKMGDWWLGLRPIGDAIPEDSYVYLEKAYENIAVDGTHTWIYTMDGTLTWSATNYMRVDREYGLYVEGPPDEWYYTHTWYMDSDVTDAVHGGSLVADMPEDHQDIAVNVDSPWWEYAVDWVDACYEGPTGYPQDCWDHIFAEYVFSDDPF